MILGGVRHGGCLWCTVQYPKCRSNCHRSGNCSSGPWASFPGLGGLWARVKETQPDDRETGRPGHPDAREAAARKLHTFKHEGKSSVRGGTANFTLRVKAKPRAASLFVHSFSHFSHVVFAVYRVKSDVQVRTSMVNLDVVCKLFLVPFLFHFVFHYLLTLVSHFQLRRCSLFILSSMSLRFTP